MTVLLSSAVGLANPVTVEVINQGPGIWGNVATGAITAGAAIAAVMLTHWFTQRRERRAADEKLDRERLFVTTELIFILEDYAEGCARVATDSGEDNPQGEKEPVSAYPELDLSDAAGDWRTLPALLMYRIRELPVMQNESIRAVQEVGEYDHAPYYTDTFRERKYQFARLGMKAVILAMRLRKSEGLPETRLRDTQWSACNVLWKNWRDESKRRLVLKRLHKQALAVFEIKNAQRQATRDAELTGSRKP